MGWLITFVFAVALGGYLTLAGSVSWTEGLAATAVAAATTAFVCQQVRECRQLAVRVPPWRVLAAVPASLVTDTLRVATTLLRSLAGRPGEGEMHWHSFRPGGRNADDAGRRALATVLVSMAPNGFVLDLRPSALPEADHGLLLHRLTSAPPLSGQDWPV